MSRPMTERQDYVYNAVIDFIKREDMPPTLRELEPLVGMGKCAIRDCLKSIEKKGFIELLPGKARGIKII